MVRAYINIYILYILLVNILGFFLGNKRIKLIQMMLIVGFLITLTSLIAAFRPESAQDTGIYNFVYDNSVRYIMSSKIEDFFSLFANRSFYSVEYFYILIMSLFREIFKSPVIFYFVQGFLSNIMILYSIVLLSKYIGLFDDSSKVVFVERNLLKLFVLYTNFCGILYTSSAIRDGLSIAFGLLGLHEGKYHQIKRMLAARGKPVVYLKRLTMGPLMLDLALERGEWRPLSAEEVAALRQA